MPDFTNTPPDGHGTNNLQIIRTPAKGALVGVIASHDILGCATHFWNGRTIPHETIGCEPCNAQVSWRWHSYCVIQNSPDGQFFLLELTAQATDALVEQRMRCGTLRGAVIKTTRRGEKLNGRVHVCIRERKPGDPDLRDPPDILSILCNLWGLDRSRMRAYKTLGHKQSVTPDPGIDRINDPIPPNPKKEEPTNLEGDLQLDGSFKPKSTEQLEAEPRHQAPIVRPNSETTNGRVIDKP